MAAVHKAGQVSPWPLPTPANLMGIATEWAWFTTHLALYPLGLFAEQVVDVEPTRPLDVPGSRAGELSEFDVRGVGRPVLLVHGWIDNHAVFTLLRSNLRSAGFERVVTTNYSPFTLDLREAAHNLGDVVEKLCTRTGYDQVHLVGHSLGGVMARYYVQRLGGSRRVHTLVTLGSPHEGTEVARWLPHPLVREMQPDSGLIAELDAPAPGCTTRFVAVWSDLDQLIMPAQAAAIDHPDLIARNVYVPAHGHMSLAYSPTVAKIVREALVAVDPSGPDGSG